MSNFRFDLEIQNFKDEMPTKGELLLIWDLTEKGEFLGSGNLILNEQDNKVLMIKAKGCTQFFRDGYSVSFLDDMSWAYASELDQFPNGG